MASGSESAALVLELMHFAEELLDSGNLKFPSRQEPGAKEFAMAESLVKQMTDRWEPDKYKDDYRSALLALIHKKLESGGKELPAPKQPGKGPAKVIDLVAVLQESLEQTRTEGKKKPEKKAAPAHRHRVGAAGA